MSRSSRCALRFLAVVVASGLASMLLTTPGLPRGPYASALSDLAVPQVLAASTCNFKACAGGSRHNIVCAKVTTASNCITYHGFCLPNNCT